MGSLEPRHVTCPHCGHTFTGAVRGDEAGDTIFHSGPTGGTQVHFTCPSCGKQIDLPGMDFVTP